MGAKALSPASAGLRPAREADETPALTGKGHGWTAFLRACPRTPRTASFLVAQPFRAAEEPPAVGIGHRLRPATSRGYNGSFRGAEAPRLRGGPKSFGLLSRRAIVVHPPKRLSEDTADHRFSRCAAL
jgi:hypothetical protein